MLHPVAADRVLDLGGEDGRYLERFYPYRANITVLDLRHDPLVVLQQRFPEVNVVAGDARHLPFPDCAFDIVFASSLLEHVGKMADQGQVAREIMRVGRRFFVATPNYYFPFELHYRAPFFHFLPHRWQRAIKDHMSLGWYPKGVWEEINLLTPGDIRRLFPSARFCVQRMLGLPQTLIACAPAFSGRAELKSE